MDYTKSPDACNIKAPDACDTETPNTEYKESYKAFHILVAIVIGIIIGIVASLGSVPLGPQLVGIFDTCNYISYNTENKGSDSFIFTGFKKHDLYVYGGHDTVVEFSNGVYNYYSDAVCVNILIYSF